MNTKAKMLQYMTDIKLKEGQEIILVPLTRVQKNKQTNKNYTDPTVTFTSKKKAV